MENAKTETKVSDKMTTRLESRLYPLDRVDEAAAELQALARGMVVVCAGWDIVNGNQRLSPHDTVGGCIFLDIIVAHAKREIARLQGSLDDKAQIRFRAVGRSEDAWRPNKDT